VRLRNTVVTGLVAGIIALSASSAPSSAASSSMWPYGAGTAGERNRPPVLAAVGDISCQPGGPIEDEKQKDVCDKTGAGYQVRWQAQIATADEIEAMKPALVAILGDEQYQVGRYQDFMGSFDHTYGAFKFLHRPAPGNHEFYSEHGESGVKGAGYFAYYNGYQVDPSDGGPATAQVSTGDGGAPVVQPVPRQDGQAGHFGADGDGWYSYDLGSWHIISLNVECKVQPGGCDPNGEWLSKETAWLERDLAADHARCTVAYWHQPTFSVADAAVQGSKFTTPEGTAADTWWKLLYRHDADLVLNGHDHLYARFMPLDPAGNPDPSKGIREFIIGTGGEALDPPVKNATSQYVQVSTGDYYGVMKLTLRRDSYDWDYESAMKSPDAPASEAASFRDTGSARCHGPVNR
jgi:hypothetical protein